MSGLGYIRMEKVAGMSQLPKEPSTVVYSRLGKTPMDPDVVLFVASLSRLMLLKEAARVLVQVSALARPTCMALPAVPPSGVTLSLGCVGNRVYTDRSSIREIFIPRCPGRMSPESRKQRR